VESGLRHPEPAAETGGLIVMVRPDPADAARAIAADLHADLAIGGTATEQALQRLEARQLEYHDLDGLARAMRRAEAVRDRTRDAVSARLSASLNTKVAIHPDTMRRAAAELLAAELALTLVLQRDQRRASRRRVLGLGAGTGTAAAGAVVAVMAVPPVGAGLAAVGVASAGLAWTRGRRPAPDHTSLRQHAEQCRSRWEQLAGRGADPTEVEQIIHRYDPQDSVIAALAAQNPAVRAAERVAVERRLAWVAAWRDEVGDATPVVDPALRELLQRDRTELWLTGTARSIGHEPDTLVVAAPYADLSEDRARHLHQRLLGLPRRQRVIVVLAPDPDAPTGTHIPGVGWVPALADQVGDAGLS
jgi:hypothetical protein